MEQDTPEAELCVNLISGLALRARLLGTVGRKCGVASMSELMKEPNATVRPGPCPSVLLTHTHILHVLHRVFIHICALGL